MDIVGRYFRCTKETTKWYRTKEIYKVIRYLPATPFASEAVEINYANGCVIALSYFQHWFQDVTFEVKEKEFTQKLDKLINK